MADGSAQDIARVDIRSIAEGLGVTKRGALKRSTKEAWPFTEEMASGGKRRLYRVDSLPQDVQVALRRAAALAAANAAQASADFQVGQLISRRVALREKIDAAAAQRIREEGTARAVGLVGTARDRMDAKLDVITRVQQFARHHGLGLCAAREQFCSAMRTGEIQLPENVKRFVDGDVSPASIGRWQRTLATQGAAALAGEYGNRKGSGKIESQKEIREFVLGLLTAQPHISGKNMQLAINARFGKGAVTERTAARFIGRFKLENPQLYTAIANPDAWKNRYMSAFGSASEGITRLNQRWEFDSTSADVMLTDGRATIVQIVDVWPRRRLFYVSKSSSSEAVSQALRRAIRAWGIPEEAKVDNGRDYVSDRTMRAFAGLGIEVLVSTPFSPWEKPHVESGFRTFSHSLLEMLPGYLGHNVADQQAVRASKSFAERLFKKNEVIEIKLSSAELQQFCDRWCSDLYEHESQQGLHGQTVFQRVASWTGEVRRIENDRVLDLLLAPAPDNDGIRRVGKKGIRVDKLEYIAPELHCMVGESVQVLYDEQDAGRIVVYHNGAFCCIAECPEILGVSRAEIAAAAAAERKRGIAAKRAEMQALKRKANVKDIAFEILDAKARENASLAMLPLAKNVIDASEHFAEAQRAAEALDDQTRAETKHVAEVREEFFKVLGEARDAGRLVRSEEEEIESRMKVALEILMKDPADRTVFDNARIEGYCQSSEFRGRWTVLQSFGVAAFHTLDEKYNCFHEEGHLAHRLRELDMLLARALDDNQ